MATLLLVIIYISYVGLGVPDPLFGTAWPAIYLDFGVPISSASIVSLICSCSSVVDSLNSARLIKRLGTGKVTMISVLLTVIAILGYSLSPNLLFMCLMAVPLRLGGGGVDAALNSYVALHYHASHMNFLHSCFGLGVTISPYLMSIAFERLSSWRNGYHLSMAVQFVIFLITLAALPLWKRVGHSESLEQAEEESVKTLSVREMARIPAIQCTWLVFITSCGIEYTSGVWAVHFWCKARAWRWKQLRVTLRSTIWALSLHASCPVCCPKSSQAGSW